MSSVVLTIFERLENFLLHYYDNFVLFVTNLSNKFEVVLNCNFYFNQTLYK